MWFMVSVSIHKMKVSFHSYTLKLKSILILKILIVKGTMGVVEIPNPACHKLMASWLFILRVNLSNTWKRVPSDSRKFCLEFKGKRYVWESLWMAWKNFKSDRSWEGFMMGVQCQAPLPHSPHFRAPTDSKVFQGWRQKDKSGKAGLNKVIHNVPSWSNYYLERYLLCSGSLKRQAEAKSRPNFYSPWGRRLRAESKRVSVRKILIQLSLS